MTGGIGIATGKRCAAKKRGRWPSPQAACSLNDEYNRFRDQVMNVMSLIKARVELTTALTRGHQTSQRIGWIEDDPRKNPVMTSPISIMELKAMTNQGMT